MIKLTLRQGEQTMVVAAAPAENILAAVRRAGIVRESPCNGNGTCGKCLVKLEKPNGEKTEVLACQTPVLQGAIVEISERQDGHNLQIKQDGIAADVEIDSTITKEYLPGRRVTVVYRNGALSACETGDTTQCIYGVAVDIGTTTLVVALVDLQTGRELAAAGALNPQSRLAQDVLSRIRYASHEQGLAEMHRLVTEEINRLIIQVSREAAVAPEQIYELVVSGNTCMLHLAAGIDPSGLGKYPYTPLIRGGEVFAARDIGLAAAGGATVYFPPVMSGYVGADITAGVLAARLAERAGITLFIDIGTNGEMILAGEGVLTATSTAAGPAFEGMNISCGMRAAPGAIETFQLLSNGDKVVKTIGGGRETGICGSGLLDIVSELVRHGLIGKNGKFAKIAPDAPGGLLARRDNKTVFPLAEDVFLSQQDVRQVQLAKGAIRAGIEAMLKHRCLSPGQVDRVLIAGSFGYHLNPDSMLGIGLLPGAFRGKIEFLGNTAKTGSQMFLLNQATRRQIGGIIAGVAVLELANMDNFDRLFVKCLEF
ncbi:MAG: ASKHA domain-containing protein [Bacillota bacterium]